MKTQKRGGQLSFTSKPSFSERSVSDFLLGTKKPKKNETKNEVLKVRRDHLRQLHRRRFSDPEADAGNAGNVRFDGRHQTGPNVLL